VGKFGHQTLRHPMIGQVAGEKEGGRQKSEAHKNDMSPLLVAFNKNQARHNQKSANTVEAGVQ
jgi:hypothetical protein